MCAIIVFAPMNEYELHFGDFIQLFDVHVMISNNFSCYWKLRLAPWLSPDWQWRFVRIYSLYARYKIYGSLVIWTSTLQENIKLGNNTRES